MRRFHPSFVTSIGPPPPPQRAGENSLPPGVAANLARNLRLEMWIAESGAQGWWPQQRSLFPTAKCNPGRRDRHAMLPEFSVTSRPPQVQGKGETVGHRQLLS